MAREGAYIPPHRRGREADLTQPLYVRRRMMLGDTLLEVGDELPSGLDVPTVMRFFRLRMVSNFRDGDQSPEALAIHRERLAQKHVPVVEEDPPKKKGRGR